MSINLLPWREQQKKHQDYLFYGVSMFSILIIFLGIFLLHVWILSQLKKIPVRSTFHKNHDYQAATLLRKITRHQKTIIKTLIHIGQQMPLHCQLVRLAQYKDNIEIEGRSGNSQAITLFIHRLKNIHSLNTVFVKKIEQHSDIHFIIQTTMRTRS